MKQIKALYITAASILVVGLQACGGGSSRTVTPQATTLPTTPPPFTELAPPSIPPTGPDYHPTNKGWFLAWSDEFNGNELDTANWEIEVSCWGGGNDERQCYTDRERNVEVVNEVLRLVAYPETFTGPEFPQNFPDRGSQITQNYTSGKVRTIGLHDWKYGRFEARVKLPQGQGTWPAFWMMPANSEYGTWPLSGEIDIMETVNLGANCTDCGNSEVENRAVGSLHFGSLSPNNQYINAKMALPGGEAGLDNYHVFAVEWGEGRFNWFVNGELYQTRTADDWFTDAVDKTENENAPFDKNFYLMFNFAVGGNYPENTNENRFESDSFPSQLLIDWVRVYQCEFDGTSGLSCMQDAE